MKRRFSNKIIKKPQNIQPIGFWNCFHSISPAELETLGQRRCHNRQVPGAMTSNNPSSLPSPRSHRSVRSRCHLSALISHGKRQPGSDVPRAPGISCRHEHGGKNVQVCHPCKLQNTLRKNSKCPEKGFMTQGSQQKGLEDLSWFVG